MVKDTNEIISASQRLGSEFDVAVRENKKLTFADEKSNKSHLTGKLRYWWSWFAAAMLLLVVGGPSVTFLYIINRRIWLYPFALWGAKTWLKACGAEVRVTGKENLDPDRSYVFASNHRSYLDTAALFCYTGKRIGLVAKKELLKAPVLGQGNGFCECHCDRQIQSRACASVDGKSETGDGRRVFVRRVVEGTRAMPGELLPFKKGAFHLALQTDAPIVPVAITNTDWMMGKKTGVAYPGVIEISLLPPIETRGRELMDLLRETRAAVADELGK
jgi:1-acyl-sn-glycerol-3-phosphate acyltransferase